MEELKLGKETAITLFQCMVVITVVPLTMKLKCKLAMSTLAQLIGQVFKNA
jgi:hypothetical protein